MEFLVNDLSIHGQFSDIPTFQAAIGRVMAIRKIAQGFGRELSCHRSIAHTQVTHKLSMPQVVQALPVDERRALMQWLTRQGPFWEDTRLHGPDDYLEWSGTVVTDNAVGEAAYCHFHGLERHLVSLIPSSWAFSPVSVRWVEDSDLVRIVDVQNYWCPDAVASMLQAAPVPLTSWNQLQSVAIARCPDLEFASDAIDSLLGHPFSVGAAERILVRLDALQRLKTSFDEAGQRTSEGHRLVKQHFAGQKAWFSDSSEAEKTEFEAELTFRHPRNNGESLFCTWHGKVKTPQLRIHFSWPIRADEPLYVVYIGPKITKR